MGPEANLEKQFMRWCIGKGGVCLKLGLIGMIGFPDRTILLPGGRVVFIEFKTPVGVVSVHQQYWIAKLQGLGFTAGVARSLDEAIELVAQCLPSQTS